MALTKYDYEQKHSVFYAISEGYRQVNNEHWGVTGVAGQIVAGAIMAIAAAAVLYGTYQVASKLKDVAVEALKGKDQEV